MPKTLKNRRNKRSKTQRGGVLGLSSTILAMRSFDKEDFKTVYNYLRGETGASRFNGFPKNVNNSKKEPPDSILNFDRFKELYLYFKNQEKVAHDRALGAIAAKVVIRFKSVVNEISNAKKRGDSTILAMLSFDKEDFKTVYNYLRGETGASRFNGFPKNVNNSKKEPPDSILNFDRFKELYGYFKTQEKVAHDRARNDALFSGEDPNTTDWDIAAIVVIRFERVVKKISEAKKRGDRLIYRPQPETLNSGDVDALI